VLRMRIKPTSAYENLQIDYIVLIVKRQCKVMEHLKLCYIIDLQNLLPLS